MSFQELFTESKGQPIIYKGKELKMMDKIYLHSNTVCARITFISIDSKWKQGVILQINGEFEINGKTVNNKIVLWESNAPKEIDFIIKSKNKTLTIYNVWETEDMTMHYWHNGGAMYIEEDNGSKIYYCNDGYPDDDLNDLIFRIDIYKQ